MIDLSENNIRHIAANHCVSVTNFLLCLVDLNIVPHEELPSWIYNHNAVRSYRQRNFKSWTDLINETNNVK